MFIIDFIFDLVDSLDLLTQITIVLVFFVIGVFVWRKVVKDGESSKVKLDKEISEDLKWRLKKYGSRSVTRLFLKQENERLRQKLLEDIFRKKKIFNKVVWVECLNLVWYIAKDFRSRNYVDIFKDYKKVKKEKKKKS